MRSVSGAFAHVWTRLGPGFLPFADAATSELPLGKLLRLSLFQVSVGMATSLISGTLNRVMIVELDAPAWLVALMISLPVAFAPLRPLVGFRSDVYVSALGWRRVPFIWIGTLLQFGGLAIMPFALIVFSGDTHGPAFIGQAAAALSFLLVGAGLHTTQTAGLALATDAASAEARPRIVALLYLMLLVGLVASSLVFGVLLADFSQIRLIQVIQGAALVTMILNGVALWKQEPRNPSRVVAHQSRPAFGDAWRAFAHDARTRRLLVAVGLGTAAFTMQDILLEPYGGHVMRLAVGATSMLTALLGTGALIAFGVSARSLARGADPHRLAASGALIGVAAFSGIIFAAPLESLLLFGAGTALIGFGGGLFSVGTLTAIMVLDSRRQSGLALGAWGAVQACSAGAAMAVGGAIRDTVSGLATQGVLGPALSGPATGYSFVYHLEILLLFAALAAIGPLVSVTHDASARAIGRFGLAEFPG